MSLKDELPGDPRSNVAHLAVAVIRELEGVLPPRWKVQPVIRQDTDLEIALVDPGGMQRSFVVEARLRLNPSDVRDLLGSPLTKRLLRNAYMTPLLVVAPFLSSRTRQLLIEEGHNYLDLTGNTHIAVEQPGIFIHTQGADRDPLPSTTSRGLRGTAAGKIVRFLIENETPITAADIADATGANPGYVSRILEYLSSEALIDRLARGPVTKTDIDGLAAYRLQAVAPSVQTAIALDWLRDHDPVWLTTPRPDSHPRAPRTQPTTDPQA